MQGFLASDGPQTPPAVFLCASPAKQYHKKRKVLYNICTDFLLVTEGGEKVNGFCESQRR